MTTAAVLEPVLVRRKRHNAFMLSLTAACTLIALSVLFSILGYITWKGLSSISWTFLTRLPAPVGEAGGGIANAIVGSMKLVLMAAALGVPIGVLGGVYLAEYGNGRVGFLIRYAADLLNGVPSIVMGIFAYTLIVLPMRHFSAVAGAAALAIIMIPLVLRNTEEFVRLVPQSVREAGLALGVPRWKVVARIVLPTASKGILTGALLAVSRVAGETAPVLFTAFGNRFWGQTLLEPIATLPLIIFTYAIAPYEEWHRQAWAAALVLLIVVLGCNVGARMLLRVPQQSGA